MKEMEDLKLEKLTVRNGRLEADVFAGREDGELGNRYVTGGYIAEVRKNGTVLTDRPRERWCAYEGQGLPEVFEMGMGMELAQVGEPYLRIGVGKCLRGEGEEWNTPGKLVEPLKWELREHSSSRIVHRASDRITFGKLEYGYEITRLVEVIGDRLFSETSLLVNCPWSVSILWFAHPFFRQIEKHNLGVLLPGKVKPVGNMLENADGGFGYPAGGGFQVLTDWARNGGSDLITLTDGVGGQVVAIQADYSVDKVILFATQRAFSIEPYFTTTAHDDRLLKWRLTYDFGNA